MATASMRQSTKIVGSAYQAERWVVRGSTSRTSCVQSATMSARSPKRIRSIRTTLKKVALKIEPRTGWSPNSEPEDQSAIKTKAVIHSFRSSSRMIKKMKNKKSEEAINNAISDRTSPITMRSPDRLEYDTHASGSSDIFPIQPGIKSFTLSATTKRTPTRIPNTRSRPTTESRICPASNRLQEISELGQRLRT